MGSAQLKEKLSSVLQTPGLVCNRGDHQLGGLQDADTALNAVACHKQQNTSETFGMSKASGPKDPTLQNT